MFSLWFVLLWSCYQCVVDKDDVFTHVYQGSLMILEQSDAYPVPASAITLTDMARNGLYVTTAKTANRVHIWWDILYQVG